MLLVFLYYTFPMVIEILFFVLVFIAVIALFLKAIGVKITITLNINSVAKGIMEPFSSMFSIMPYIFNKTKKLLDMFGVKNAIVQNVLAVLIIIIII